MSLYTLIVKNNVISTQKVFSRFNYLQILSLKGLIFLDAKIADYTANFLNDNNSFSKIKLNIRISNNYVPNSNYREFVSDNVLLVSVPNTVIWKQVAEHNDIDVISLNNSVALIAESDFSNIVNDYNNEKGLITSVLDMNNSTVNLRLDSYESQEYIISIRPEQATITFINPKLDQKWLPTTTFNLQKL
jgi:hypothetical protein